MSKQYDQTNSGALFKNDRKEKPTHPDYKGSINVDGVDYWVSSWLKQGQKGTFMSLALTKKEEAAPAPAARPKDERYRAGQPARQATGFDDMDDDIPF